MQEKGQEKEHWLWRYPLFLPRGSIRAIAFLGTLCFLGFLVVNLHGQAQMTIVGGFISLLTSALHFYFESKKEKPKESTTGG